MAGEVLSTGVVTDTNVDEDSTGGEAIELVPVETVSVDVPMVGVVTGPGEAPDEAVTLEELV